MRDGDRGTLAGLWKRPDRKPRDRSIVTLAALIARNQTIEMAPALSRARYRKWANAAAAVAVAKDVFAARKIGADQLPAASPQLLPLNEEAEESRASGVQERFAPVARGVVQYTTDVLFRDLWLRPTWRRATGVL